MSAHGNPDIVTDGLVLCLDAADIKSYPKSGTTWNDRSGNGNNGTLVNGVGYSNGAMVFDGVNDYVDLSDKCDTIRTALTIDVWVKFNSLPINTDTRKPIVSKYDASAGKRQYSLILGYNATNNWDKASWNIQQNSTSYSSSTDLISNQSIIINRWYNIVGTFSGGNFIKLYINGEFDNQIITNVPSSFADTDTDLTIGTFYVNNIPTIFIDGSIPSTKIYNKALSPAEILQNYNATKSRFNLL
jgi:hypothetical protein